MVIMKKLLLLFALLLAAPWAVAQGPPNEVWIRAVQSDGTGFREFYLADPGADRVFGWKDSEGVVRYFTPAEILTLIGVEAGATADQSNAEIETAYNAQVAAASQVEMEAGTEAAIRRMSPLRIAQAIAALGGAGGDLNQSDLDTLAELNAILTDATLIDTADARLSDTRDPNAHTHPVAELSDASANGRSLIIAANYAAMRGLLDLEAGTDFLALPSGTPDGTKFLRDDNSWQLIPGGGDALTTSPLSQFAATTSAQLAGVMSNETGSGALVFATSPTLITPDLGTPSALVGTNITGTAAGLTAGTVSDNAITLAKMADDAVGLAEMAAGTAGNLITYDVSGNPVAVATGTTGQALLSNGAGAAPTFQTLPGGGDALTTNPLSQFAATTSAQLRGVLSDEDGTGQFLTTNGSAANLTSFPTLNQSTTGNADTATLATTATTANAGDSATAFFGAGTIEFARLPMIDDDTFATASATTGSSSESIKAYVDAAGGSGLTNWGETGTTLRPNTAGFALGAVGNEVGNFTMLGDFSGSRVMNDAGTTFNIVNWDVTDTASNALSNLIRLRVGGTDQFRVRKDGTLFGGRGIELNTTGRGEITGGRDVSGTQQSLAIRTTISGVLADRLVFRGDDILVSQKLSVSANDVSVGIGTAAARLHTVATTTQFRAGYDSSNYLGLTVGSTGTATWAGAGTNSRVEFTPEIRPNGGLRLQEKAAALAAVAGLGEIWVKNDTPNTIWFTDDAGTDTQLGGGGGGSGDVVGPASSTDATLAAFDGPTGKLIQDSTIPMADVAYEGGPAVDLEITSLVINESAAGPTVAAGEGAFWVKDDVPNTPWFKDDASTEFQIATIADIPTIPAQKVTFFLTIDSIADGMDYGTWFTADAVTISEIRAVHVGTLATPDIDIDIRHSTDRSAAGNQVETTAMTITSSTTGDSFTTGFEDATVPANSWIWVETSSISGTTDNLEIVVRGTYD
jgi:hypothetical protein